MKKSTKIIIGILLAIALGIFLLAFQANQLGSTLNTEKEIAINNRDEAALKSSILKAALAADEAYSNSIPSSKIAEESEIIQIKEYLEDMSGRAVVMNFSSPENDSVIKMGYLDDAIYYCVDNSTISTPELLVEVESTNNPLTASTLCDGTAF